MEIIIVIISTIFICNELTSTEEFLSLVDNSKAKTEDRFEIQPYCNTFVSLKVTQVNYKFGHSVGKNTKELQPYVRTNQNDTLLVHFALYPFLLAPENPRRMSFSNQGWQSLNKIGLNTGIGNHSHQIGSPVSDYDLGE